MKTKSVLLIFPAYPAHWSAPAPGIGYIASALEGIGVKVKFIDCQITRHHKAKIISLLSEYPVVGISVNAGNVSSSLEIAGAIRKVSPGTKIIMGGPHATAVYDKFIPEYADIVVRGEGEDTIAELMKKEDLSRVTGIAYWDGKVKVTPARPYIENLDRIKFPACHLYNFKKYRFRNISNPFSLMITSRGCPYECIYCFKSTHGYKIRFRSIDNILDEVDYLVTQFGVREIQIMDDVFTINPERVKQFCKKLIACRYKNLRFALGGGIRVDAGDQEMFDLLAQAGCYMLDIAIESGSQNLLDKIHRPCNLDSLIKIINMIKKSDIQLAIFSTLGFPFDTIGSIQKTIDFIKKLNVDSITFTLATPYPGTEFYEMVKNHGRFLYDPIKQSAQIGSNVSYETPTLKAKDIEAMFKQAHQEFYFRPRQIFKIFLNRTVSYRRMFETIKLGKDLIFRRKLW